MGREVRMVAPGWEHPKNDKGHHIPLRGGSWLKRCTEWDEGKRRWAAGEREDWGTNPRGWKPKEPDHTETWEVWEGERPSHLDYMPDWPEGAATLFMMYEDTTEGTPISPAFATPEELARWLADNGASAFGDMTATYTQWLATIRAGSAPSMILSGSQMTSGVAATEALAQGGRS